VSAVARERAAKHTRGSGGLSDFVRA
jgi:hypothetical protein